MDEKTRAVQYALKRAQAQRNCERHIQQIMFSAAKRMLDEAPKYRNGSERMLDENGFARAAKDIAKTAQNNICNYINRYAGASCTLLGVGVDALGGMLDGKIFGETTKQRTARFLTHFAEDITRMVKAASLMHYSDEQLLAAVRTGYKDPYRTSVVTKAKRKDFDIDTPSYGKGFHRNAYQNIVRNARQVIALAWGAAEQEYGKRNKATGFKVFRGSSYPCPVCDDECSYTHSFRDPYPPFHVSCVCYTQFVFANNK